jgi:hypothetical protein
MRAMTRAGLLAAVTLLGAGGFAQAADPATAAQERQNTPQALLPAYQPPQRGTPEGRIGGATRGLTQEDAGAQRAGDSQRETTTDRDARNE